MTDHHKFQFIMKKAFNLVSTFKNTPWYNETNGTSKKNINIEDINIQESPSVPIWEKDISDNYTDLSFGSGDISGIHTISSGNYNSNEYMSSGVHLDSTGTVALFVRLKLDKMDDYDICDNAYAYTVYPPAILSADYPTRLSEDFENESTTTGFEYLDITSVSSIWTNASSSNIVFIKSGNSSWGSITSYKGDYHLGLQLAGTFIETTIYLMSGTYNISFATTARGNRGETTPIILNITSSGGKILINNYTYANTQTPSWYEHNISFVVTTSDNITIKFENGDDGDGVDDDRTVLIDAIELRGETNNLLLENAYQFNYNSQINVNATIPVFKPYNYTLEYSSDGTTFNRLANSDGNWIFDNKTGIITFEENPTVDLGSTDLYFTFVKYLGAQGLQNLLYYKNGKVGINVSDPQSELDVLGSVSITGDLDICGNLDVDTDVLCINSTSQRVGINTGTPETTLDVSGSVYIDGSLDIGYGIGPGFYPIGAIIMWPTNSFPNNSGYGTWLLCNGQSCSGYASLVAIVGGSVPDFTDKYVKMVADPTTTINFTTSGNSATSYTLLSNNIPQHAHSSSQHNHTINDRSHSHNVSSHSHNMKFDNHAHSSSADHSHDISDNGHDHEGNASHDHTVTQVNHLHNTTTNHGHTVTADTSHTHTYNFRNAGVNNQKRGDEGNRVTSLQIGTTDVSSKTADAKAEIKSVATSSSTSSIFESSDSTKTYSDDANLCSIDQAEITATSDGTVYLDISAVIASGGSTTSTVSSYNMDTADDGGYTTGNNSTSEEITSITDSITDYSSKSEESNMNADGTSMDDTYTPNAISIDTYPSYRIAFYFIRAA